MMKGESDHRWIQKLRLLGRELPLEKHAGAAKLMYAKVDEQE